MNSHMDFIKEQLYALTGIPSPSGFTKKVTDYLLSELTALGFAPERSRKGNVFVTLGGSGSPLVLAAHVDTLGAMVRSIKENGRLRPTTLGVISGPPQMGRIVRFTPGTAGSIPALS